jgi:tyrosyl-tRNA synthetase
MTRTTDAIPTWRMTRAEFAGVNIVNLLWATGEFKSKSEIRRLIKQGGLTICGQRHNGVSQGQAGAGCSQEP